MSHNPYSFMYREKIPREAITLHAGFFLYTFSIASVHTAIFFYRVSKARNLFSRPPAKSSQPHGVCHEFCWEQAALSRRCPAVCGPLTAGRFACPAGYSGLSGAIGAGREQAAAVPLFAPHGAGAGGGPPLMLSPPLFGAVVSGARRCVLW